MKKVLIADSHPLFRDFLKQKLSEDQIEVITTQENRDIYTKVITSLPNLIILDMEDDNSVEMEFLEKKMHDTNYADIPVIITGPKQDRANIAAYAKYGVIKYFEKPVQFDMFLSLLDLLFVFHFQWIQLLVFLIFTATTSFLLNLRSVLTAKK